MALREVPNTRFREIYGGRRIEDKAVFGGELTQPLLATSPVGYEQLPVLSEVMMDFGRMFNRLNVKKFDGKLIGQTLDREDILPAIDPRAYSNQGFVVAPDTRNMWGGRKAIVYGNRGLPSDYGGMPEASGRLSLFRRDSDKSLNPEGASWFAGYSKNEQAQILIRGYAGYGGNKKSTVLRPGIGLGWTGHATNSYTDDAGASDNTVKNWMQNRFNYSKDTAADAVTRDEIDSSWLADEMYPYGGLSGSSTASERAGNELILDYMANALLHSSALSFLHQYHDALINIASQTQYLSSELVGFYEKGLKGDFLRHYSDDEVYLMISLVELGAALRRQVVVRNTDGGISGFDNTKDVGFTGAVNPFFMYVDKFGNSDDSHSVKRMYTPWWLTMLIDRHYFEYDESVDDVRDIHREDLFQGIRVLLEAASLEYGMIVKSTGTPYLDFFKDFETATLHDFTDYGDVPSLRSLMMAGYSKSEDYAIFEDPSHRGYSFFKDFISRNKIVETERLDLQKDYAEMDSIAVITGDMFKLGQQMLGDFEYTTHHRLTRFGSKSVDVKVKPDICWRPLSAKHVFYSDTDGADMNCFVAADLTAETDTLYPGDTWDADIYLTQLHTALGSSAGFTDWIAFPSLNKGWDSKLDGVLHERNDPALGYGHIRTGAGITKSKTMYPMFQLADDSFLSALSPAIATDSKHFGMGVIDETCIDRFVIEDIAGAHNTHAIGLKAEAPLVPTSYWRLGTTGMLGSFVLRMNKIYQAWQGRTSGLFRRSELKNLLNFPSYNLARELKMNTPDPNLAKNADKILGIMGCGAFGYSPALSMRNVNRKLEDSTVHARSSTGLYGNGGEPTDADLLVSPYHGSASDLEDMFFSQHLMAYLMGLYSDDLLSLKLPGCIRKSSLNKLAVTNSGMMLTPIALVTGNLNSKRYDGASWITDAISARGRRRNSSAREWDYFPIGMGPTNTFWSGYVGDIGGVTTLNDVIGPHPTSPSKIIGHDNSGKIVNYACMRTFYHYYKPLDGDITYVTCTKPALGHAVGSYDGEGTVASAEVFNFRTELVGLLESTNGTTYDLIPGHMETYKTWQIFERHDGAGVYDATKTAAAFDLATWNGSVPSICSSFGTSAVASESGSITQGLGGFQGGFTALTMPGTELDNGSWLTYLESRLGGIPGASGENAEPADLLKWRTAAAKLFVFDQDVLDKSEGLLGALLYITFGITHPGQVTYAAVLGADGSVDWEIRDSYGWGDAGAIATTEDFMATESSTGDIEPLH